MYPLAQTGGDPGLLSGLGMLVSKTKSSQGSLLLASDGLSGSQCSPSLHLPWRGEGKAGVVGYWGSLPTQDKHTAVQISVGEDLEVI